MGFLGGHGFSDSLAPRASGCHPPMSRPGQDYRCRPTVKQLLIGNVQLNWPKLFQAFAVIVTLIFSQLGSFNHSTCMSTI